MTAESHCWNARDCLESALRCVGCMGACAPASASVNVGASSGASLRSASSGKVVMVTPEGELALPK